MSVAEALTWPHLVAHAVSGGQWMAARHLQTVSSALRDIAVGRCKRLMIFMPPRHGKSELVSKWFPAWYLNLFPARRIILTSYEATYAAYWGQQAMTAWQYTRNAIGHGLRLQSDRADWWKIERYGGYMTTAGIGGAVTGKGADVAIIDDPVKNPEEAYSKARRDTVWNWYLSTLLTRLEPGGSVILMMTRWHDDDLAGRALRQKQGAWRVITLPALAEIGDQLGREPGQALWPERFPAESLQAIRDNIGPRWWSALYQQSPRPAEGDTIKREWFRIGEPDASKTPSIIARGWDLAATEKTTADYTAGAKIARYAPQWWLLDLVRRQIGAGEVPRLIRSVAEQDGRGVQVAIEREPGASGKIASTHLVDLLSGFHVQAVPASGDKLVRALPFIDQAQAGNVWLRRAAWNEAFLDEAEAFPHGAHDDQIDAAALAFNAMNLPRSSIATTW